MQEKIIVCPNEEKIKILNNLHKKSGLHNIKFMTKKEYLDNYFFSYNEETLFYLMNKYNWNLDVCKIYLNNLYSIDCSKNYEDGKLNFLKKLKQELIENKLLVFNKSFQKYISKKELEVKKYYNLELYEEKALNYTVNVPISTINACVYEFQTLEEEVNYVCVKIIELIKSGIDINKIVLTNISDEYLFTIRRLFNYYHIPININFKESIYSTKVVQDYLKTKELDLDNKEILPISKKLLSVLSSLSDLDSSSPIYEKILIDKLKHTNISFKKKSNAVSIRSLQDESFDEEEYVFVLGFNQDVLPKMEKDIDFIPDSLKDKVDMYKTNYKNERNKKVVAYLLSRIKNLYISYKLSTPFSSYYPSSLISEFHLEVVNTIEDCYKYSNLYNKLRLGEKLDEFYLYGDKTTYLDELNATYNIPYKTYQNTYTGINNDLYLKNLDYPLKLSYTSLNCYNECKFKYYLKYVLKLDNYEDTFAAFIGSMYHKILSLYKRNNFDLEFEFQKYIKNRECSLKERLLLIRIKKELQELISTIKKQELLTGYDSYLFEQKAEVQLEKKVSVVFVGYIDKIMYYKKIEDTYFSIIDYKSGTIDTHIEPLKYGLHMQLPVYLYLIHYSRVFTNPIFTGIYYQNILFDYPTWSEKIEQEKKERYLLQGYSTEDISLLERFDSTYTSSEYIKSMKYSEEKGFGTYSKTINNDMLYDLVKYTKKVIEDRTDEILESDFSINPKIYAGKNISCEFCNFKDLCFKKDKDNIYQDKVDDLSFLGGEE